jgi:hypothetical protein
MIPQMNKTSTQIRIRVITYLVWKPIPPLPTPRSCAPRRIARVSAFRGGGVEREKMRR